MLQFFSDEVARSKASARWPLVRLRSGRPSPRFFFHGFFHRSLKTANAFTEAFAQLRQLLRPKDEKGEPCDVQQMRGLKQSVAHCHSFALSGVAPNVSLR